MASLTHQSIMLNERINLFFVNHHEQPEDAGDEMKMAFQDCVEAGLHPKWISEVDVLKQKSKTDVIIFEQFQGEAFDLLRKNKCVICGPRCIRTCLNENSEIPANNSPVFTTAMRGLVVTATNIDTNTKMKVKEKVSFMGGVYTNNLVESVTHVVCGGVRSVKYDRAVDLGLSLMKLEWVDAVWQEALHKNIHAANPEFTEKYNCPIFLNLEITTTNLSAAEKNKLQNIINSNGGNYCGQLKQNSTDILIVGGNPNSSAKYKFARTWNLACVKSSWVYESVEKGYAVNSQQHIIIPEVRCSTPTGNKEELPSFAGSDISMVSTIPCPNPCGQPNRSRVDETNILTNVTVPYSSPYDDKQKDIYVNTGEGVRGGGGFDYKRFLDDFNFEDLKKAGPFLDGCKVYLSGFNPSELDKLRRILNVGGATIFTELTDAVSHVIAGEFVAADGVLINKAINRPHVIGIEWIGASLKQRSPALESLYSRIESSNSKQIPPSPLSQKGVRLLTERNEFKSPSTIDGTRAQSEKRKANHNPHHHSSQSSSTDDKIKEDDTDGRTINRNLFLDFVTTSNDRDGSNSTTHQSKSTAGGENVSCRGRSSDENDHRLEEDENFDVNDESTSSLKQNSDNIFKDLVFMILGFDNDITNQIDQVITNNCGRVVSQTFKGVTDYTVVPLYGVPVAGIQSQVVAPYWLDDCCESKSVIPVEYYHQPISIAGNKAPLEGCVITLSVYSLRERQFLGELVVALGALCQETFARKTNVNKGVYGNTHLVIPTGGSSKFNAAVKWNIPAVNKEWLLACAKHGMKMPEEPYSVAMTEPQKGEASEEKNQPSVAACQDNAVKLKSDKGSLETPPTNVNKSIRSVNTIEELTTPVTSLLTTEKQPLPKLLANDGDYIRSPKVRKISLKSTPVRSYQNVSTPETPYEEIIGETGKSTRKRIKHLINRMEIEKESTLVLSPAPARRMSTPLSELMRKAFEKFGDTPNSSFVNNIVHDDDCSGNQNNKQLDESFGVGIVQINEDVPHPPTPSSPSLSERLAEFNKRSSSNSTSKRTSAPTTNTNSTRKRQAQVEVESSGESSSESNTRPVNRNFNSQKYEVGWEEPVESAQHAKLSSSSSDTTSSSRLDCKIRKFVISNVQEHNKKDYIKMIKSLGGTLLNDDRYSFETTHLLTERPIRSEKLLCSIAAGRWVLHVSYLDQSHKANMFLPEEDFEWGNPRSKENIPPLQTEREINLASAAFRWRNSLQASSSDGGEHGAFEGMRAVLLIDNKRLMENISRLISAGKGTILDKKSILEANYCFIDCADYEETGIDFCLMASKNIYCLRPIYLGNFLTESPTPDPAENAINEYKDASHSRL